MIWYTTLSQIFDSSHKFIIGRVSDGEDGGCTLRRGRTKARFQDGGTQSKASIEQKRNPRPA